MESYGWKSSIVCWTNFTKNFRDQCSFLQQLVRSIKSFWRNISEFLSGFLLELCYYRLIKWKILNCNIWWKSWIPLWTEGNSILYIFLFLFLSFLFFFCWLFNTLSYFLIKNVKKATCKSFSKTFHFWHLWQFYTWHLFHFSSISIIYRQCLMLNSRGVHLY